MTKLKTITPEEAKSRGFRSLTTPMRKRVERHMIDRVVADLTRRGVPHLLVEKKEGIEVWRSGEGWVTGDRAEDRKTTHL